MFCGCYIASIGAYFGVIAKLGPFCSRDNCSLVRGGFGQVDYLFVGAVSTCILVGWRVEPGCGLEDVVLVEGVGAMSEVGTVVGLEAADVTFFVSFFSIFCSYITY